MTDSLFPFTASNGLVINRDVLGGLVINATALPLTLPGMKTRALREFFQAERDESLGRWRSKEHPDYVVYQNRHGQVNVLYEPDGLSSRAYGRGEFPGTSGRFPDIAAEYFAAHPEPKPWHDAKPGEAWLVTADGDEQLCVVRDDNPTDPNEFVWAHGDFPVTADYITAAERVHPRGGDES